MPPRCLPPSQLGQIYKHHGGFRVQLSASMAGFRGVATRIVRGPQREEILRARQDLARARKCPSREAMVAFLSGGCRQENLPSNPEILRAEQRACFSSRRLCGKRALALMETCVVVVCLLLIVHSPLLFCRERERESIHFAQVCIRSLFPILIMFVSQVCIRSLPVRCLFLDCWGMWIPIHHHYFTPPSCIGESRFTIGPTPANLEGCV